jgi:hypothetical protein
MTCAPSVDYAATGERVLVGSCGFGASSGALACATPKRSRPRSVQGRSIRCLARKRLIEYATSSKFEREYGPASLCMSVFE